MQLLEDAEQRFKLTQRERICLGVLALKEASTARELMQALEVDGGEALTPWLGRLPDFGLVQSAGRTQATRYFVTPELLRGAGLDKVTTLKRIEPHRLRALVEEDLQRYPGSAIGRIRDRIGPEIPPRMLKRTIDAMIDSGVVRAEGNNRGRRYSLA